VVKEKFEEGVIRALNLIEKYFSILRKSVRMEYVEIDVPGPQDQIKRRLNSLRNQFDTFIMKYELD